MTSCNHRSGVQIFTWTQLLPFATYAEALAFSQRTEGAEAPLALIRQCEYIEEPNPGEYLHIRQERIAEWSVEFLVALVGRKIQSPIFFRRTLPPTGWTYYGVWQIGRSDDGQRIIVM